ncbi:competence type IV pilus minor pilin ComGF [Staphylococcus pseudoxylosus]|uniref:competence type IV pilus minor pilin ComGF n=2 Tax=Staphylococcus pseudoxylosus TaxID=2282419 RepID=UPI000D1D78EB|nr:competence type IV pilus minor pilin ComGF [Staphylococcus pseudoxylosus]MBM2658525.1 ComGF family competence protein [Staphylococcus pseudoxylosus]MDW8546865.1 competence type IV pilus minor pilin ComGF [Staphylococcus pseudoxylosus]MEB6332633.1 ComGF family competence protein [Staphylococcus pseudoxylosus]PTI79454.1 competence protein [Staphylococcus xylosus]
MKNAMVKKLKAFTYVEVLFALFITILIFTILPSLFKTTHFIEARLSNQTNLDLEFFAVDLTRDLLAKNPQIIVNDVRKSKIVIKNKDKDIIYELKNNKIIKSINGKGNITLLNNVKSVEFKVVNYKTLKVNLNIIEKGNSYEKQLYI